ncbi:MAG: hypothetical protein AAF702_36510 [Chloroflexota bacterium]
MMASQTNSRIDGQKVLQSTTIVSPPDPVQRAIQWFLVLLVLFGLVTWLPSVSAAQAESEGTGGRVIHTELRAAVLR